jgi:nitrogen regulatory protein P-II 1
LEITGMKIITAVIEPLMLNKVTGALESIEDFPGMTVSDARGLRRKRDLRERREPRIDEIKGKVFIEIFTPDEKAQQIVETLVRAARTGESGEGKAFAWPVESAVSAQTGEDDERRYDATLTLLVFNDFRVFQLARRQ